MDRDRIKSGLIFLVVLLLGIITAVSLYFYQNFCSTSSFMPGVRIAGIPVQGYNTEQAASRISQVIDEAYATQVAFFKDDYVYECKLGDLCLPIDVDKEVQSAWNNEKKRKWRAKIANLNGVKIIDYKVGIPYNKNITNQLASDWSNKWNIPSQNAHIQIGRNQSIMVIPGKMGIEVDTAASLAALPANIGDDKDLKLPIIIKQHAPQVDEKVLSNMGILATYSTSFRPAEINRSHNLFTATAAINGALIESGALFSYNNQVGECSREKGYKEAMVIISGKFQPGVGGGICQVSSTLYNACLLAGLDIVERYNHNLSVSYVPLGQDATVAYGLQDFKFRNNTDSPLYLRAVVYEGTLTVSIFGNLKYKRKISVSNVVDQTIDYQTFTETDPLLPPGTQKVDHNGQPGYVVRSFRTFYDTSGNKIKTVQLARDHYLPLNKLVYQGPAQNPAPGAVVAPNPQLPIKPDAGNGTGTTPKTDDVQNPPLVPVTPDTGNQTSPALPVPTGQ